jgi:hypothetical protein
MLRRPWPYVCANQESPRITPEAFPLLKDDYADIRKALLPVCRFSSYFSVICSCSLLNCIIKHYTPRCTTNLLEHLAKYCNI